MNPHNNRPEGEKNPFPLKGGFLLTEEREIPKATRRKAPQENCLVYPLQENDRCEHCDSIELDSELKACFRLNVCEKCRELYKDTYRLITKTTAKSEYLLTEEELQDSAELPSKRRTNPYKSTWSDMQLYTTMQVQRFAVKKWGSIESLTTEIERREKALEDRRQRRYKDKLKSKFVHRPPQVIFLDLRAKTLMKKKPNMKGLSGLNCKHQFELSTTGTKKCVLCDLVIEEEEF